MVDVLSNGAAAAGAASGEYDAAICAPIGAARHRLTLLADKIADHPDAVTRFALVSRPGPPSPPTGTTSRRWRSTSPTTGSARCCRC